MTRRVVLIDDIIGQEKGIASANHPNNFRRDHEGSGLEIHFAAAYDTFLRRYHPPEAVYSLKAIGFVPDLILVDLLFGDSSEGSSSLFLGLDIIDAVAKEFPNVPRALFTTISADDRVSGHSGETIGQVLARRGAGYFNKDEVLGGSFAATMNGYLDRVAGKS